MTSAERELLLAVAEAVWSLAGGGMIQPDAAQRIKTGVAAVRGSPGASLQQSVNAATDYMLAAKSYASRED